MDFRFYKSTIVVQLSSSTVGHPPKSVAIATTRMAGNTRTCGTKHAKKEVSSKLDTRGEQRQIFLAPQKVEDGPRCRHVVANGKGSSAAHFEEEERRVESGNTSETKDTASDRESTFKTLMKPSRPETRYKKLCREEEEGKKDDKERQGKTKNITASSEGIARALGTKSTK